ncbi:MAG: class I SAM-dependent methyltransferase [Dehalococcoidia bacterium]
MAAPALLPASEPPIIEPGSFRDPAGGVVLQGGRVFRYFSGTAGTEFLRLLDAPWFGELIRAGGVVESWPLARAQAPALYALAPEITAVVEHPRIPFVSYAYEWPFQMLRAAALHQLEVTSRALANGHMVKDATPYNVQFTGTRPVFLDAGSFERHTAGEGWRAYAQFCRMFLNPLYLQAYGGIAFQPWLRSSLEGIDTDTVRGLLPLRAKLRWAVFMDVVLQSVLNRRFAKNERALRSLANRTIPDDVVRGMLARMTRTVERTRRGRGSSAWVDYEQTKAHYSAEADAYKEAYVRRTMERDRPGTVLDLGCNTGQFSLIAAGLADHVVAVDSDEASVDALFLRARASHPNILPLVMDLTNPSPDQGWAQAERRGFAQRAEADLALCLALIHHVAISGNVPFGRFVDWLASVARTAIVEFVPKSDPMVERLLFTRKDVYAGYTQKHFEAALAGRFTIVERSALPAGGRVLYTVGRL